MPRAPQIRLTKELASFISRWLKCSNSRDDALEFHTRGYVKWTGRSPAGQAADRDTWSEVFLQPDRQGGGGNRDSATGDFRSRDHGAQERKAPPHAGGGGRLEGSTIWIVSEHGRRAAYVRNIAAEPRVRVKLGRRWRSGTARALSDDAWRERLKRIGHGHPWLKLNGAIVRLMRTDPLTIRIDLD